MNPEDYVETAKAIEYMNKFTDIKLSPAKFRKSKGKYSPDKTTNII